jgi:hypothetical protein
MVFVFSLRYGVALLATPVDVVIAGDRKPRLSQFCHGFAVLPHLYKPRFGVVVAVDEIPYGHREIWVEEIRIDDSLGQDLDPILRTARSISKDCEMPNVISFGERQFQCCASRCVDVWRLSKSA